MPDDGVGIDVPGQRHLNENAMHHRVLVQSIDEPEQVGLSGGCRKTNRLASHTELA